MADQSSSFEDSLNNRTQQPTEKSNMFKEAID